MTKNRLIAHGRFFMVKDDSLRNMYIFKCVHLQKVIKNHITNLPESDSLFLDKVKLIVSDSFQRNIRKLKKRKIFSDSLLL